MSNYIIKGDLFLERICDLLGLQKGRVGRVVIDAPANAPVAIYVQYWGDTRLLSADLFSELRIEKAGEPA